MHTKANDPPRELILDDEPPSGSSAEWINTETGQCSKDCPSCVPGRLIIMGRDTKHTDALRGHLEREGVKPVLCPVLAPNCNAFAERFMRSIKDECLDRMILFAETSLRRALKEYVAHYYTERNHQSVGNRLLNPTYTAGSPDAPIQRKECLVGMLNYYYREAA